MTPTLGRVGEALLELADLQSLEFLFESGFGAY